MERAAASGDPGRFAFPRPLKGEARLDFSFSGLKTAVRQAAEAIAPVSDADVSDICASFQAAIVATLEDRLAPALARFRRQFPEEAAPTLVVAGGVAANSAIRGMLDRLCGSAGLPLRRSAASPLHRQCGDDRLGRRGAHGARDAR